MGRRRLRILLCSAGGALVCLGAMAALLVLRFQPVARDYFISALRERYRSSVELGDLRISFFPSVHATGDGLVLRFGGRRDLPPMVRIRRFELDADLFDFFRSPKHIGRLRLEGLQIHPPPRSAAPAAVTDKPASGYAPRPAGPAIVFDEVTADGSSLEITPENPARGALLFDIRRLTLRSVGAGQPMTIHVELRNPTPPGLVVSDGRFGPWNAASPAETPVSGKYSFRNADLSVFTGIAGKLSSEGNYAGRLDRLEVTGTTDVPDFALTIAGQPVPLHTDFRATVDGTNGDTTLDPVHARLGRSEFDVTGAIERAAPETRKTILLKARSDTTRLEDFLRLSVRSPQPPMTGALRFDTNIRIPPGKTEVVERLELDGTFALNAARFTSADVQSKVAGLSHLAQGNPQDRDPDVAADFAGHFRLRHEQLNLPDLQFSLPGARVSLRGSYALRGGSLDFRGTVRMDATVSQMTTGFKRTLLRPLDRLFSRDGAGTVVPVHISGTREEPSLIFDIGRLSIGVSVPRR